MVDSINLSAGVYNPLLETANNNLSSNNSELLVSNSDNKFNVENNHDNERNKRNQGNVKKAAEEINKRFDSSNKTFRFFVDEKTGQVVIKIINKDTNEVIKEIPSAELLDLQAKIEEMVGLIIDRKV